MLAWSSRWRTEPDVFVEFWSVGSPVPRWLRMTTTHISAHLAVDWLPSFPASISSSLVGWPPFVIETVTYKGQNVLSLVTDLGRNERQWKGVVSWMLGVAGSRH